MRRTSIWLGLGGLVCGACGQTPMVVLPAGSVLPVSVPEHLHMRIGEPVHALLTHAVYVNNVLTLPEKTVVTGRVVTLKADHGHRVKARLRFDFTPFRTPVVAFDGLVMPDGETVRLAMEPAENGAAVYRLVAPPPRTGGFLSQQFAVLKTAAMDRIHVVTGPDKRDRLTQFLFTQLPYHPQRIEKDTAWTLRTSREAELPLAEAAKVPPPGASEGRTVILEGYLKTAISSEHSKAGEGIRAVVSEPVLNPDGSVAVPEGAVLTGTVTEARPARWLGRSGRLVFSFNKMALPEEEAVSVQTSLKGADVADGQQLAMDSEGQVKPKPQDKLVVPAILLGLAARPLDRDGGRHMLGKDAVASNSLGLIGFLVGTAAQKPNVAGGIGYYGAALSIYERVIAKGKPVTFGQDTRMEIQTTPRRSAPMGSAATPAR